MKKQNPLKQIISVIMTFIILIQFPGCYTTRTLNTTNLTTFPDEFKYNYIIHTDSTKFQIFSVSISDGKLSGTKASFKVSGGNSVHIYLNSGTQTKLDPTTIFKVSLDDISKIEIRESNVAGTIVLSIFGLIAIIGLTVALTFHIDAGWSGI